LIFDIFHYYSSQNKSFNVLIYEDSNSIKAKIDLAKSYNFGGISLWSLHNLPDYNDSRGNKFHLNGWETILEEMNSYDILPTNASEYISFTDDIVEQAIREKLMKPSGSISAWEMQHIYRLKLPMGVKSLNDIKMLTNLNPKTNFNQSVKFILHMKNGVIIEVKRDL